MNSLEQYGWDTSLAAQWQKMPAVQQSQYKPARVVADFGSMLKIVTPDETTATLSGRLQHFGQPDDFPKVGDWVAVQLSTNNEGTIETVLPRRSEIARKVAGRRNQKQIMAANVDVAFVLQSLDNDFSPERLQRYLYQLAVGHIEAILVLNKADQAADVESFLDAVAPLGVRTIVCSALTGEGVGDIRTAIEPGQTAVLLGSSGVGKSTLTNLLIGHNIQKTHAVRESDSTGRHTTTHRELFVLPNGGLLIDTPGIRELQLWGVEEELVENFDDILELASLCKYNNCRHGTEIGCRIQGALKSGELDGAHYQNFLKMRHELQQLQVKAQTEGAIQKKKAEHRMRKRADKNALQDYDD